MTFEQLHLLNDIYNNHERAVEFADLFGNYKEGKNIVVLMSNDDYADYYGFCPHRKYPINSNAIIPSELISRIKKTIDDYAKEQYSKISSVQCSSINLI
jgi:nitrite reductase/ring-hydroxylating ferredoxin subunit